ncbi:hypothetical protein GE21DRAFT_7418 [Neurospora crassa]|uniref:Uncharacterized protein n=1 Tax=Neurospora crassa (strain ATCC 24698 / 74-OR23-1A / CBS 708.71 / DSM 1257 / FGSC 987) TaxID=367110 RepID=Q7S738_NEUCR|nr:hypothetical protein NCU03843 [Neurospora crassa OR74A]EAA31354.2 hypothetical protein NCU03843 [Neurospora crassa OR74A]KHE88088.1 hypothetical protein GE21DRAFT_7418 [Neurospora crassa]|eukprot:XP_960590.2 hypothetical protein NCU03843 [Neurospora crassa OR74A]
MLIRVGYHPIYRAHLLLARGVGGIEFLPPNLQRMDKVANIFNLYSRHPSEVPGIPSDLSSQDALRPETVFQICTAAKRDFDPFIASDLGEFLARIRHVLSLVLGHPDCNDEDRKKVDDAWQCVCHDLREAISFIVQNMELLCAAWEAGRPYLGPDTKAGRARMTKAQATSTMELKLADPSSLEPDNPSRESINEACFSSPATTAPTPEDHRLRQHELIPNPTPPGSFPSGDKEECVNATRTALGALSLSEQNRRGNKTTSPERARRDQHEDEGYKPMSDMGHVSPEDDEDDGEDLDIQNDMHEDEGRIRLSDMGYVSPEDDDSKSDDDDNDDGGGGGDCGDEQGQNQLQHRYHSEDQEEERRLGDQTSQVRNWLLPKWNARWQALYQPQLQQVRQLHLQQQRLNLSGGHGETPTMRWRHNDSSSEGMDGQMKSVKAGEYPFSRRPEEAECSTLSSSQPNLDQNITDPDSHSSNGNPIIEEHI